MAFCDEKQRDSYMVIPRMHEFDTRHEAVGELAKYKREGRETSLEKRVVVVKQPEFSRMLSGEAR
ncbi:hypothetical protein [Halocatena marina]|uniref:hypothetical protein n=1 Tax=Halocatena marina TaxID=2934937 RepID=UPI00200E68C7|nr:hypothetical protein [Halocatena marina]